MNELKEVANGYIGLLAGALASRAKAAPTQQQSYEPLATAMTQLALCLRKPNTTHDELVKVICTASMVWTEWQDNYTRFWDCLAKDEQEYLEQGDLFAEINQLIVGA